MSAFFDFWIQIGMVAGVFGSMFLAWEMYGKRAMIVMAVFLFSMITLIALAPFVFGGNVVAIAGE